MPKLHLFYRNMMTARYELAEHFACYKWWYLLFAVFSVLGLIIGLITGFKIAPDATVSNIPDSIFLSYIQGNVSAIGVFFSRLFSLAAITLLILISNLKPYLCFINVLYMIYRGFVIGATLALLIVLFNVGGVLNVVFIIIPCHCTTLFCLISFSAICAHYNFENRYFGGCVFSPKFFCEKKIVLCVLGIIIFIALLLEAILLPWLASAIIIG